MTPTKKGKATHIKIERKKRLQSDSQGIVHVAGGQHQGLVVAKDTAGHCYVQHAHKCPLLSSGNQFKGLSLSLGTIL